MALPRGCAFLMKILKKIGGKFTKNVLNYYKITIKAK
jgi:hypothetical protein